jgi:phenylpyruvate tautomerase PptA (4-oxalocrotonate tautomerase family)
VSGRALVLADEPTGDFMPSLQIDVPIRLDRDVKRLLAKRFGLAYAARMMADLELVTVSIHDLGEGSVWRCTPDEPLPHTLIMCDVRRGRSAETRASLARHLIEICADVLDLDPLSIKVEFTQHSGDEMFHPHLGGFNIDWTGRDPVPPDSA